jgi:hypothetical protein
MSRSGIVFVVLAGLLYTANATAQAESFSEYGVKAAFLYSLPSFVDWPEPVPAEPEAPITVCVIGEDPFGASLDFFEGKPVKGRPLHIVKLAAQARPVGCAILFISKSAAGDTRRILASIAKTPVLTVGDVRGFTREGGVVALLAAKGQVHLEINLMAAQAAGLSISSKLLRMAHVVNFPLAQVTE